MYACLMVLRNLNSAETLIILMTTVTMQRYVGKSETQYFRCALGLSKKGIFINKYAIESDRLHTY
jgi:hypothetical protein